jgi:sodium-dependent dicarboxylate transporter 2/3/5
MSAPAQPITDASEELPAGWVARAGLVVGPLAGAVLVACTHPALGHVRLAAPASWTLGLLAWMAIWWMTQAVPMAITSLLPALLLPLLGVGSFRDNAAHYADNIIFLFAGAGMIGLALERHGASERFTRALLGVAGTSPAGALCAVFAATMGISAFMSNAATTAMMVPLAMGIIAAARPAPGVDAAQAAMARRNFATVLLLAAAYASTVGGAATIVGSPPNAIAAKYLTDSGIPVDFMRWARFAVPVALLFAPLALATMALMLPVRGLSLHELRLRPPSPFGAAGWLSASIFACTVFVWVTASLWPAGWRPTHLTDGGVAIAAASLLFVLPASARPWKPLLSWRCAERLPWGVYILFGGGLSLADAMQRTGLSAAIGQSFTGLGSMPAVVVLACVVAVLVFASEIASNTALTATAVPILGALAPELGIPPERLVIAAAFGASYAFMMPVGTPPNAMVYATGLVPHGAMLRVGLALNLIAIILITLMASWML